MRIAIFVGSVIVATAVTLGGLTLLVLADPHHLEPVIWLAVVPLTVFLYGPLMVGAFTSYWDVRSSPETWRYFRRWFAGIGLLQVLGAVSIVLFAALTAAPLWLPVAFVVLAVLLNALALRLGPVLRRREEATWPTHPTWAPITRQEIVRKILVVAGVFVGVLIVGGVGFSILLASVGTRRHAGDGTGLLFAGEFAFMGAALACIVVSLSLNRLVRVQVTRDVGQLRRLARVVVRGRSIALDPDEQVLAAKYAAVMSVAQPFTLTYVLLLYVALGLQQVEQLMNGSSVTFAVVYLALLVLVLVALGPLYVVRVRRSRRYAREHADLLPTAESTAIQGS